MATIRSLAWCVNTGAIESLTVDPGQGVYASRIPYHAPTRTVTFVVNADAFDLGHNPQGIERPPRAR